MTGKAQSLPINAGHGVAPESLLPYAGKRKSMAKPQTLSLRSRSTIILLCIDELAPWQAHKHYGQRATSETWIEEAKNQSALAHIKTADFWVNSALFQTAILAYNILRWMALFSGNKILNRW